MAGPEFTTEELKSEEWRHVVGYEGVYSVSDLGRIRRDLRIRSHVPGIRKPSYYGKGYAIYGLSWHGKINRYTCARLVLAAFVGPCPPAHQANHIDGHKANNRLTNLEWVSRSGNQQHAIHILQHVGGRRPKLTEDQATEIRSLFDAKLWAQKRVIYEEIANIFHVPNYLIERIIEKKSYTLPRAN